MKLKTDFVTNSSSTSYIIISKKDLTSDDIVNYLGVKKSSPIYPVISTLANTLLYNSENNGYDHPLTKDEIRELFDEKTAIKYSIACEKGDYVYIGEISSDSEYPEVSMCLDSEVYNYSKEFFMDFSPCVW